MILIFDTETTGLPKDYYAPASEVDNWPRLVQLAWQIYDIEGKLLEESDNIIKPTDFVIPDEATKVHGISNNRALNSGKDLKNVLTKFRNLIEKADVVVGHNIEFDLNIIKAEFYRAKILDSFESLEIICTMKSTTNLCKIENAYFGYKYPSLNELHIYLFGTSVNGSHNAQVDVYYTAKCFWKLRELGFYEDNFTKLIGREALIKTNKRWKSLNSTERNNLTKLYNGLYNKPEYIYELLDKTALVTKKSPDLTSLIGIGRIRKLETLNISFTKIKDLAGIQSLDLKYIILHKHEYLEDISAIEGCKNLRKFAANYTKIKDISPLKNMKNLKELSIQNSPVTDLEIINNFELETFSCSNMKLSHIDFLTKHKKLKELDLSYNNLADLTPLKLNTDLVDLNLSGNIYLNDISILRKFKNLKQLKLNFTGVTDFSPLLDCKLDSLEINGIKLKTFKYFKNQNHMLVNLDPNFFVLLDNFLNKHISISKVGPKGNLFKVNSYSDNYGIFSYLFDNVS